MNLSFIPLNGKCPYLDYDAFEASARKILPPTCKEATIILFNNFPALVSTESIIDLIIVIALKDEKGNFYAIRKGDKLIYLNNLIIPVSFILNLQDSELSVDEDNDLFADSEPHDFTSEMESIRQGLMDYLTRKCYFKKSELFIKPIVFVKNKKTIYGENFLVANNLDFKSLMIYVSSSSQDILCSYKTWKTEEGYSTLQYDIERVNNQASKDSQVGYLTMKKILLISKQLSNERVIFNALHQHLIIVKGKAGTGKTSELLLLIQKCISSGQNTVFLTYNKLLIFDVARTLKSYFYSQTNNNYEQKKIGLSVVTTLHRFFYRVSLKVGALHLLSEYRLKQLKSLLDTRSAVIKNFITAYSKEKEITTFDYDGLEILKEKIQNHNQFDVPTKEVGVDFANFMKRKSLLNPLSIDETQLLFVKHKAQLVYNITANEVFLSDYYGVLAATLLAITNSDEYIIKYDMQKKFELLHGILKLKDKHLLEGEKENTLSVKALKTKIKKSIGGHKGKGTVFIDEAQDCHELEKQILFAIYGAPNIVISTGGKEQLIRHVELCNWKVLNQKAIPHKEYRTVNKSFRIKKSVLNFCNFIAAKYKIELKLEPFQTEDDGELILDFRRTNSDSELQEIFKSLSLKGKINNCTPCESILVLIDSSSKASDFGLVAENDDSNITMLKGKINEFGNIEDSKQVSKTSWKFKNTLEKENELLFWDGALDDKSDLLIPNPTETRLIFYESCRGLEAWSVTCFNIDKFFNQKREDPDAEKYLMGDLFSGLQNEERKDMYAGTWALMAITRAIDTLYLKFDNPDSSFSKVVLEYINQNPTAAKVLR